MCWVDSRKSYQGKKLRRPRSRGSGVNNESAFNRVLDILYIYYVCMHIYVCMHVYISLFLASVPNYRDYILGEKKFQGSQIAFHRQDFFPLAKTGRADQVFLLQHQPDPIFFRPFLNAQCYRSHSWYTNSHRSYIKE